MKPCACNKWENDKMPFQTKTILFKYFYLFQNLPPSVISAELFRTDVKDNTLRKRNAMSEPHPQFRLTLQSCTLLYGQNYNTCNNLACVYTVCTYIINTTFFINGVHG